MGIHLLSYLLTHDHGQALCLMMSTALPIFAVANLGVALLLIIMMASAGVLINFEQLPVWVRACVRAPLDHLIASRDVHPSAHGIGVRSMDEPPPTSPLTFFFCHTPHHPVGPPKTTTTPRRLAGS